MINIFKFVIKNLDEGFKIIEINILRMKKMIIVIVFYYVNVEQSNFFGLYK